MTTPSLRRFCLPLAVLTSLSLSACASSSVDAGAPRHTTGTLPAAAVSTPRPKPSPSATTLTKAQFVTKMEAVCADFDTRIQAVTNSKDPKTVAGIVTVTQTILTLYPQYLKQADALVGRSSDKATLTRNWLRLEKSDFAGVEPVLKRYLADVKALDSDAVAVDAKVLDALPDHSEAIAGFMSGYGLKKCAALQSS